MAIKVYVAAGCLAATGALLAAVDYARRGSTLVVEVQPGAAGGGQKQANPEPKRPDPSKLEPDKPVSAPAKPETVPVPKATPTPAATDAAKRIDGLDPASLPMKIGLDQAWTLHGDAVQFIDGRKPEDFAAGHIPGSVNIRALDIQSGGDTWRSFYTSADPGSWYVVYCDGGDCHESEQIRAFLVQAGFKNVLIFEQGYPGWIGAKLPTEKP